MQFTKSKFGYLLAELNGCEVDADGLIKKNCFLQFVDFNSFKCSKPRKIWYITS